MKNLLFLALLITILSPLVALPTEERHSLKLGIGLSGGARVDGFVLDFVSPRLFSINFEEYKRHSDYHLFLEASYQAVHGLNDAAGPVPAEFQSLLTIGTLAQVVSNDGPISPYTKIGLDIAFPSSRISTKSTSFGLRVAFGCDFIFSRAEKTFLGTSDSSFFLEGGIVYLHQTADRLPGSPAFLDGFIPKVGLRTHF